MNFLAAASSRTIFDSLDINESTKLDYLSRLPMFLGFTQKDGISKELLMNYKKYLRSRADLGVSSKNKYLAVARITLRELYRKGVISVDLSIGVKSFSQSVEHKVPGLTENEVQRICGYLMTSDESFATARLRAIIALLIFQGLRQIEICRLNICDVDLANGVIRVLGKGKDDKETINLHPQTYGSLKRYLKQSKAKDGPLFTPLNASLSGRRLSVRGLRSIVQIMFNELDITKTVHGSRHYFATTLIRSHNFDLLKVAKYTRHKDIQMLQVYNDDLLSKSDLPQFYESFKSKLI